MAGQGSSTPSLSMPRVSLDVDLRGEARHFLRGRMPIAGTGIGVGVAFVGIGGYALGRLARSGVSAEFIIGVLLLGLGVALVVLTLRNGLVNPVLSLHADPEGVTYVRRWWAPVRRKWSRAGLFLLVEDLAPDTVSSPEEKQHLFFTGPNAVYGSLSAQELGPILDAARENGLSIGMKIVEQRTGQVVHRVRRIRIVQGVTD